MLVRTVGFFWREDHVFWGKGNQAGRLLGVPPNGKTSIPVDFREQIGIYVLYADYKVVYVGQAGVGKQSLFTRLKQHRKDDLAGRWDRFSWFGLLRVVGTGVNQKLASRTTALHPNLPDVLNHIEGILIHAVEPSMNSQGGRFGENVTRYHQVRDSRLGLTQEQMLRELCKAQGITV
ncbi:GIY-YIG nuclease family protein [Ralstonia sp. ASV6]|uniref:GIY-YIG nuclease family protein n=1 Tax=Ralstonia sp. ASV6 TaxID=2795124 RepID=UPI0018ECFC6A|nr:GIY-YIG nuclease family protein [Ralstonia sp. ASV6]